MEFLSLLKGNLIECFLAFIVTSLVGGFFYILKNIKNIAVKELILGLIRLSEKKLKSSDGTIKKEWVYNRLPFLLKILSKTKLSLLIDTIHAEWEEQLNLNKKKVISTESSSTIAIE